MLVRFFGYVHLFLSRLYDNIHFLWSCMHNTDTSEAGIDLQRERERAGKQQPPICGVLHHFVQCEKEECEQ